jgi:hypothetical protein
MAFGGVPEETEAVTHGLIIAIARWNVYDNLILGVSF